MPLSHNVFEGLVELSVRIFTIRDSECTISSGEAKNSVLAQFIRNRAGEILEHMDAWRKKRCLLDDNYHTPGPEYHTDLPTC